MRGKAISQGERKLNLSNVARQNKEMTLKAVEELLRKRRADWFHQRYVKTTY